MKTKPLYVLIGDGRDGSYSTHFTFNTELIEKLKEADEEGLVSYENCVGVDGEGFGYETLNVPVKCTAESLGITVLDDDYADQFFAD